jgi:hypothetical protein
MDDGNTESWKRFCGCLLLPATGMGFGPSRGVCKVVWFVLRHALLHGIMFEEGTGSSFCL